MTKCWETLARPWGSFLFQVLFTSSHDIAGHWVPSWEPLNWIYVLMRYAFKSEEHHMKTIVFKLQACCKPFARFPRSVEASAVEQAAFSTPSKQESPHHPTGKAHFSGGSLKLSALWHLSGKWPQSWENTTVSQMASE